ncbi:MAG: transcription termination/antitermination protein NusG, partial [Lachnospiraceae bacterium]|nr:transcription termination/antitermination protein NusG [Lachnospiraceae bacterium]
IVHMVMNDKTWYIFRNTRVVTGFVGPGSKPVPLTEEELINLGIGKPQPGMGNEEKAPKRDYGIKVGDLIAVVDGTWRDTEGKALKIDDSKQTVTINVEMFGRETPLEVPLDNVRRMG